MDAELVYPDALYVLAPEAFTAARDAAAKQARTDGDTAAAKALTALRKPSVGAWVVNRLAAEQSDLLGQLLALGPALAQAQSDGRADELRALGQQRRELVEAVTSAAVGAVGRSVSTAVREQVAATLEAALSDPASADAVRSARLVRALSYAGFGGVDLSDAVAAPPPVPDRRPAGAAAKGGATTGGAGRKAAREVEREAQREAERGAHRAAAVADAEQAAHDAAGRFDDAVRTAERAERGRTDAAAAAADAERAVTHARAALAAAEQDRESSASEQRRAEREAAEALEAVRTAQQIAGDARAELDRLRRG